MRNQTKQPMMPSIMSALRATIADDTISQQDRLEAVVIIANSYGLWVRQSDLIDPSNFAVPNEQWVEIADLLTKMAKGASPLSAVNASLSWMNYGPSAYEVTT